MKILIQLSFFFLIFVSIPVIAQDKGTDTKTEKKNDVESARMKRKKAKAEWKAKRKQDRGDKKAVRQHEKRLQTKATRKRMHKDQRKANRTNQNKKQFFLIRLFKPKPRTGAW
ncbi:MAG: hypothetical protein HY841_12475 [Bacteroidetes bacterium]|nr:hypothetical protein [Bacteroidota bacterium]